MVRRLVRLASRRVPPRQTEISTRLSIGGAPEVNVGKGIARLGAVLQDCLGR